MNRRFGMAFLLLPLICVLVTATTAGATARRAERVQPGFGTPAASVAGFVGGLEHRDAASACAYVEPKHHALCLVNFRTISLTGSFVIARTVTDGDRALVSATGKACLSIGRDTVCGANANRSVGLPSSRAGFDRAYQADGSEYSSGEPNTPAFWVQNVIKLNGRWYQAG